MFNYCSKLNDTISFNTIQWALHVSSVAIHCWPNCLPLCLFFDNRKFLFLVFFTMYSLFFLFFKKWKKSICWEIIKAYMLMINLDILSWLDIINIMHKFLSTNFIFAALSKLYTSSDTLWSVNFMHIFKRILTFRLHKTWFLRDHVMLPLHGTVNAQRYLANVIKCFILGWVNWICKFFEFSLNFK
mgnify:CR=1 FL=1